MKMQQEVQPIMQCNDKILFESHDIDQKYGNTGRWVFKGSLQN